MAMRHHSLSSYLAVGILIAFLVPPPPLASGDILQQFCDKSWNYTANSTYQSNLKQLSAALPKNASSSPALFTTASVGAIPDTVYALTLCRGDTNASDCAACVANAFHDAQQVCAYNMDVTIYYDPCLLRFSNQDFLANQLNTKQYISPNSENVTSPTALFDAAVGLLINAVIDYAVLNSSKRFGTGEEDFDKRNPKIYGLAQCTPDMAPADCRSCLEGIMKAMPKYFSGRQGGGIMGLRCTYRYELYPFFSGGPLLHLQAPASIVMPLNVAPPVGGGICLKKQWEETEECNSQTLILHFIDHQCYITKDMLCFVSDVLRDDVHGGTTNKTAIMLAIVLAIVSSALAIACRRKQATIPSGPSLPYSSNTKSVRSVDSFMLDLSTLQVATDYFAERNKLGEGGFGAVYKGTLPDGQEIAVKRLSQSSKQGISELKNELVLVAKLQHKNLVRLVGVCLDEHEKLLVYEYLPNRSLDTILFDPEKSKDLDWGKRFKIINGIARGLQYVHEDSQLKIIHRDLKASNVLLDSDLNPKISDFGLARLVERDQSKDVTNHVVGTFGYMAPEYVIRGQYSIRSDVFSFGILVLEIITGRRNSGSYNPEQSAGLLSLIWEHWTMGTIFDIMDPFLSSIPRDQMLMCVHIGLLCVQESPADRPMMSTVNVILSNTVSIPTPSKPAFCIQTAGSDSEPHQEALRATRKSTVISPNEVSLTELEPR